MNIKYILVIIILSLFILNLSSCSSDTNNSGNSETIADIDSIKTKTEENIRIIHNNFDHRWVNLKQIEPENDTSLNYVCNLKDKLFSTTFETEVINTYPKDSSKEINVFVKYNIFLTDSTSNAKLVCSIDSAKKPLVWKSINIEEYIHTYDEWVQNENAFRFNISNIDSSNIMKIFFWNPERTDLMIDDITIEFQ